MYIPIGPSKKDLYKIIIGLLLILYLIFLGMYKPKALTTTTRIANASILVPQGIDYGEYAFNTSWTNHGEGIIHLSMTYTLNSGLATQTNPIRQITLLSNTNYRFLCDIGSFVSYLDSGTQFINYSATCPVNLDGMGINKILITVNSSDTGQANRYNIGEYISFVSKDATDLSTISSATTSINNSINDSSIDNSSANDFTSNSAFQDSNGLDAIIKAPLNFIQSLTSSTCSAINLTIPYIDAQVSLPCMSTIYTKALGQQLVNLIALVINGVVLYRYCLKILQIVKDAKNPNKDGLEVLDL